MIKNEFSIIMSLSIYVKRYSLHLKNKLNIFKVDRFLWNAKTQVLLIFLCS